jgi:hypothetical protein
MSVSPTSRATDHCSVLSRSAAALVGTANRRAVCVGAALAIMTWALARYGVRTESSTLIAVLMVASGSAAAALFEMDAQCPTHRLPSRSDWAWARWWAGLQGGTFVATLHGLGLLAG